MDRDPRRRESADGDTTARRPNRVLLLVVAVAVLVAALAVVLAARRSGPGHDPATPEGTVQSYLTAVLAGDHDEAARFLAAPGPCSVTDLDRTSLPDGVRVVLRAVQVTGDAARVDVDVALPSGGVFGGSETFEKHTFRLTRSNGSWLLVGEPWPLSGCGKTA